MRIRSIRPEFWRSDDVDCLNRDTRLLFVGLWSYADDNGVGRDRVSDIAADLFAGDLSRDPRETLAMVADGLDALAERGLIRRYEAGGKALLFVTGWDTNQRIDRPAKERYKRPTCEDAATAPRIATPSRQSREGVATGEGEKGRRGEGEKSTPSGSLAPRKRAAATTSGTRIPDDFPVTDDLAAWARENAPNAGQGDHDAFCDYWRSVPGAKGRKADWPATWRNWMRRASDERARPRGGAPPRSEAPMDRAAQVADIGARMQAAADAAAAGQIALEA